MIVGTGTGKLFDLASERLRESESLRESERLLTLKVFRVETRELLDVASESLVHWYRVQLGLCLQVRRGAPRGRRRRVLLRDCGAIAIAHMPVRAHRGHNAYIGQK